jgi:PPM family protein phosphatase
MRVRVGAASDIGRVRERNDDSYLIEHPLFAVADGMGGHRGGDVASSLALETLKDRFSEREGSLTEVVREANRAVYERSRSDRAVAGMGTTLTAAVLDGNRVRLVHVGDSRAYLFRADELSLLTEDHTLVHRMVLSGELSQAEAERHPHRSVLTRAIGVDGGVEVDELEVELRPGDRLLLCSDGLTGMVGDDSIRAVLESTAGQPQQAVDRLVEAANAAGGIDNITALLVDFEADEPGGARDGARSTSAVPATEGTSRPASSVATRERMRTITPAVPAPVLTPHRPSLAPPLRRVAIWICALVAVVVIGLVGLRMFLDRQWFVGVSHGHVAVFQGIPEEIAGFHLNHVVTQTEITATDAEELPLYRNLPSGITADDREAAEALVDEIRRDLARPPRSSAS